MRRYRHCSLVHYPHCHPPPVSPGRPCPAGPRSPSGTCHLRGPHCRFETIGGCGADDPADPEKEPWQSAPVFEHNVQRKPIVARTGVYLRRQIGLTSMVRLTSSRSAGRATGSVRTALGDNDNYRTVTTIDAGQLEPERSRQNGNSSFGVSSFGSIVAFVVCSDCLISVRRRWRCPPWPQTKTFGKIT